jgi:hypothetical protein
MNTLHGKKNEKVAVAALQRHSPAVLYILVKKFSVSVVPGTFAVMVGSDTNIGVRWKVGAPGHYGDETV